MNRYEMVNIIDVNWENGELAPAQKMISEEIVKTGGTVENIGSMGRRKLAYPIGRRTEGLYLVSHLTLAPEGLVPLRDSLKLNPAVIRTLLIRYGGQPGFVLREETPGGRAPDGESVIGEEGEFEAGELQEEDGEEDRYDRIRKR